MPVAQGLVDEVAGDGGLAGAVGADEDDVGGLAQEGEAHEFLDALAVAALGPEPVELGEGLEAAHARVAQAALEAAAGALALRPVDELSGPVAGGGLVPVGEQSGQVQGVGALAKLSEVRRRGARRIRCRLGIGCWCGVGSAGHRRWLLG